MDKKGKRVSSPAKKKRKQTPIFDLPSPQSCAVTEERKPHKITAAHPRRKVSSPSLARARPMLKPASTRVTSSTRWTQEASSPGLKGRVGSTPTPQNVSTKGWVEVRPCPPFPCPLLITCVCSASERWRESRDAEGALHPHRSPTPLTHTNTHTTRCASQCRSTYPAANR